MSNNSAAAQISNVPNSQGHYGDFGGSFIPETLHSAVEQLTKCYGDAQKDSDFKKQFKELLRDYVGRPSPLQFADRLSEYVRTQNKDAQLGANIYLKREDLNHTGAHKINNRSEEHTSELQSRGHLVC